MRTFKTSNARDQEHGAAVCEAASTAQGKKKCRRWSFRNIRGRPFDSRMVWQREMPAFGSTIA